MLQPKKNNNGLSESDNAILVKELTNYANEGASDKDLQDFRDTFISTKKKSTPSSDSTAQPQKSASAQTTGSSAGIGQNDPFNQKSQFKEPAKAKQTAVKEDNSFVPGSVAYAHVQNKNEDPRYTQLYNNYKAASQVPDEVKSKITQEVEDEANNVGFLNNLRTIAAKGASMVPSWIGGTSGKDIDPLYKEKDQAKKELQQQVLAAKKNKKPAPQITPDAIAERAKQIAIQKRIDSESETQVRNFLSEAEDRPAGIGELSEKDYLKQYMYGERATLNEKDKLNLKKQEILKPAIDNTVTGLKTIADKVASYANKNQPIPEDLKQEYSQKYEQYQGLVSDAMKTQDDFVNTQEKLGSLADNLDVIKRDYSWGKNFANNIAATTLDLDAGALGALDYLGQVMPTVGNYSKQLRSGNKNLRNLAQNERDAVAKPIDVEKINDAKDFGQWISTTAANQIPIFTLTATGAGGIATMGITATGQKFEEMQDEKDAGKDYSITQTLSIPLAFGATETASAAVDHYLMKGVGRSLRAATEPERRLIAEGFWQGLKDSTVKTTGELLKGTSVEALDEGATQLSQNIIDIYGADKKDIGVWDGVKDAAAAGAAMGLLLPLGGKIIAAGTKPFTTDNQIQNTSKEILKLENLLDNPELEETTRSVIEKQHASAETKLRSLVEKTAAQTASLSNEDFDKIVSLEKSQAKLKQQGQDIQTDPSIDDETEKMLLGNLKEEFDANDKKRLEILNKPVNEQNTNQTTEQEAQPQTKKEEKGGEVNDVNDTNVVNTSESNNGQITNPNNNEASQTNAAEIPNPNQINNEATSPVNIAANGDVRSESGTVGEVGESQQQQAETTNQENTQPAVESGTSESQPEVVPREPITPKSLTQLEQENRKTAPKIPVRNVFFNDVENVPNSDLKKADAFVEGESQNNLPVETVDVRDIVPTQKNITIQNLKDTQKASVEGDEKVILFKNNGKYFVIDGHHRIANAILNGTETLDVRVFDNDAPISEPKGAEKKTATFEKKKGEKSVLNRLYKGDTSDTIQKIAEDSGLTYEVENQEQAQKKSKSFVDKAGIDNALEAVRTGVIKGAEKAFVYAEILDKIQEASDNADPKQKEKVEEQYLTVLTEATNMFDQEARDSGRFISALNRIYNNSKIKYALSRQIDRYKAANNGEISDAVLAKFKEADAKIKELEAKITEAEKRAEEAEQKSAMQNIVGAIEREAAKKPYSNKQAAKKVANNIRKLKITKPDAFNAVTVGKLWDTAIEIVAKTVETGGTVADGINKAIAYIKKTKWYRDLSAEKKTDAENQFRSSVLSSESNNTPQVTVEDGVIYIPDAVIRNLVESGIKDIDSLAQAILDTISEAHPDITLRDVRDAITKYGKTVNPTKDDLQKEINQMKRLGRLISGLEDVDSGERPLRSGLQREKPSQEERKLQRELREKMRDLPLDHADLEKQWKNALDTVKSRLNNQIEDLEKQIEAGEKRKPERTSLQYDQEALNLKNRRDELRDILDEITGKPELTDEQRVQRAINITESAIEKLRKQIESGDIGFNPTPRTLSSPELDALKATRKALSEQVNAMRNEAGIIEVRKLKQAKDRVNKRIKELQDKIEARDYSKKEPKAVTADEELIKLQAEKIRWQEVYDKAAYEVELKNRSFPEKAKEAFFGALNIFRILKATGELSPVLIQGGIQTVNLAVRRPKTLLRALGKLFVALGSSRKAEQYDATMKANPNYGIMKAAKLGLVEPDYKLELREETFIGNYINNIWNFLGKGLEKASGKIFGVTETMPAGDKIISFFKDEYKSMPKVKISEQFKNTNPLLALERGLTTYMNELRMDRFNDGAKMLEMEGKNISDNKKDYEKLASAINSLTGRANMPKSLVQATPLLGAIFFSFRNTLSIVNQINPYFYLSLSPEWYKFKSAKPSVAQKVAVYDMIRFITITTSMMYLLKAAAGDDDEGNPIIDIETDPRSSDFMKLKDGNMRFDAFHGMIPMVVFFSRQFSGQTKSKGEVKNLGEGLFTSTRADLLINMGANKLSPQAGIAYRYGQTKIDKTGKRVSKYGEEYDLGKELSVTPIYIESLKEIAKEDPDAYAQFLAFMGVFGVNSQVYETKTASKSSGKKLSPETQKTVDEAKKRAQEALKNR